MSEETAATPVEQAAETPAVEGAAATPAEDTRSPWQKAIDEAPPEELRKHDRIAGIVGSELAVKQENWRRDWESQQEARIKAEADANARRELKALYNKAPLEYADRKYNEDEDKDARDRLTALEENARTEVGRRIGAAYHQHPNWQKVIDNPAEYATLMQAIAGRKDDDVVPAWNLAAAAALARVEATDIAAKKLAEELPKYKAAWEEEAAGRGLATSTRPDISRGGRTATVDPMPAMNWPQFNSWYERNTPGAKRTTR